ncbi:PTS sugar transporter subunit IIA [Enterococcus saccharolyticus]|uniref:Mannitol-specific phosphotransferase enzyme IIA component n=1 Tax=Enterococcus saccharolyticus subsp. saccharolyticus ATCC 43076 TaxID=1139996 RepID=S0JH27_9ENTE|nr:PTS sugar transporter subunit IIA [Enterococcus saccharolyticus]EOT26316.1 PTS system mannitol-specific transporter subunit IIA [Enterococcus saccharolyticus subsp. saccharolyticus ATCC 43076]EOT76276.1 PTS system mannitol-specific transporter subunit IIA [Enterococcus saccharolyticus subsp. saccharolyticus ATCC 43076]OJG89784.1 PTS system mannitol-specific transporter subunit IIA [Enterococcus saccharolyticus]
MQLEKDMILLNKEFATKEEAIRESGRLLVEAGCVDDAYVDAMIDRNNLVSTYMGNFIAIPHGTDEAKKYVKKSGISIIQVPQGVDFSTDSDEEKLAMVVFGIAGVDNEHLDILQKIAIFCSDVDNVVKLVSASSIEEIISLLEEVE